MKVNRFGNAAVKGVWPRAGSAKAFCVGNVAAKAFWFGNAAVKVF